MSHLPHDLEAEKRVLGALLVDSSYFAQIKPWVADGEAFYHSVNKDIWNTIKKLEEADEQIDVVTVNHHYPSERRNERTTLYIMDLPELIASPSSADTYAKQVHELWLRRRLLSQTVKIQKLASDGGAEIASILEDAQTTIDDLLHLQPDSEFDLQGTLEATLDSLYTKQTIIPTGIFSVDRIIGGLTQGEINIVAGRPGNGKTSFIANVVRNLLARGKRVMLVNREMPNTEMMKKFICMETPELSYTAMRAGDVRDKEAVVRGVEYIREHYNNLFMYDKLRDLPSTIREIKRLKPNIVIDDHIGLIEFPATDSREKRHQIAEISRKYKWIAKGENIPIVLVSQLNRNIEHRNDRVPRLSDLAESGSLEQDAAVVMFTHYPWTYLYDGAKYAQYGLEIIISKNRYGHVGRHTLGYSGQHCMLFDTPDGARDSESIFTE